MYVAFHISRIIFTGTVLVHMYWYSPWMVLEPGHLSVGLIDFSETPSSLTCVKAVY